MDTQRVSEAERIAAYCDVEGCLGLRGGIAIDWHSRSDEVVNEGDVVVVRLVSQDMQCGPGALLALVEWTEAQRIDFGAVAAEKVEKTPAVPPHTLEKRCSLTKAGGCIDASS
jgi:hypothetical protein